MSDGKNVLKLPGDYIDFNLNLKTILSPLFDAQKSIYTLKKNQKNPKQTKKTFETFDFLVSFAPSYVSIRHEIQGDKRNYEFRVSFCNSPIC